MDRAVLVYTTFPSLVEAEAAAKVTRSSLAGEVRQAQQPFL
jgi:hypothetical protein